MKSMRSTWQTRISLPAKRTKHGIFLALKFEDKVDRYVRLVSERTFPRYSETYIERPLSDEEVKVIGDELVDSILVDIFNEQQTARTAKTWGRWGVSKLMPKLNYLAERSMNYGLTLRQMEENETCVSLLYDLIANIRYMATRSKTVWDSAFIPTAFFKRGRAVSSHMLDRAEQIVTNLFGSEPGWWDKITSPNDDYDPFGSARHKTPKGIERATADKRIAEAEKKLLKLNPSISKYTTAQDRPGLTYDPELLSHQARVMSGEQYDRLVMLERQADAKRLQTEMAIADERSDLLLPLRTTMETQQGTAVATPQASR